MRGHTRQRDRRRGRRAIRSMSVPAPRPEGLREFSRSLPMALMRAREAVMSHFRPLLHAHGITEQQWRVLRALTECREASASEVSRMTCLSMPSLSRILRALERRALVRRRVKARDLRSAWMSIAPAGRRLVASVGQESETRYAAIEGAFGSGRLADLYAQLDELIRSLASPRTEGRASAWPAAPSRRHSGGRRNPVTRAGPRRTPG